MAENLISVVVVHTCKKHHVIHYVMQYPSAGLYVMCLPVIFCLHVVAWTINVQVRIMLMWFNFMLNCSLLRTLQENVMSCWMKKTRCRQESMVNICRVFVWFPAFHLMTSLQLQLSGRLLELVCAVIIPQLYTVICTVIWPITPSAVGQFVLPLGFVFFMSVAWLSLPVHLIYWKDLPLNGLIVLNGTFSPAYLLTVWL